MSAVAGSARRAIGAVGRLVAVIACRALASGGIAATIVWTTTGCYQNLPRTQSELTPQAVVTADITDLGRVALGDQVGPEVSSIQGVVVQRSDTSMSLLVSKVRYINGLENAWQGQEVKLRPQDAKSFTQRIFSKSRTAIAVAAIAAGLVLTILGLDFLGITSGNPSSDKGGGPPPSS
ncbi:MAG: hypothetical protein ABIS03_03195 [Gemmatimonadaceae bacterium]